jgi:uncharacterized phage protein (TIGR02220 family)
MDGGWVKIHRQLLRKSIWTQATMEQKCVFITILLLANHEDTEWEWKGERFTCGPGQFISSLKNIAKEAGVSKQNVRTALKRLEEKYDFLTHESTQRGCLITICNWDKYQKDFKTANTPANTQLTHSQHTANTQLTPNKNDKNEKNEKNEKNILTLDKSSDVVLPDFQAVNQNVQTEINFNAENQFVSFIKKFNEIRKSHYTTKTKKVEIQFVARIKEGYTAENMIDALKAAMKDKFHIDSAFKYLTPEFMTRSDKIEKYLNQPQTADSGKDGGEWSKKMLENFKKNKS